MSVINLNEKEKIFLAGAMKSIIMADGNISAEEIDELLSAMKNEKFTDYEKYMELFESTIKDQETFWEEAEAINNQDSQVLILNLLNEIAVHNGFASIEEDHIIKRLEKIWE